MLIKKILRLRKQNDAVKLMFLFCIFAMVSFAFVIVHIIEYAKAMAEHVEYIAVDAKGSVTDEKVRALSEVETVLYAGRNLEQVITFQNGEQEMQMPCSMLEEAYIRQAYRIEQASSMQTFYANDMAFLQLRQVFYTYGYESPTDEMKVSYMETDAEQYKTAKIVRVDVGEESEPYLFCIGDPLVLKKNAGELRILLDNQSDSHNVIAKLNALSLSVQNTENIEQIRMDMQTMLLKVRYECMIAGLCALAAFVIGKLVQEARR